MADELKPCPFTEGETDICEEMREIRAWLRRHLDTHVEHRAPARSSSVNGTDGWAVVAIPDWDVKQRLDEMDIAIAAWNTRPDPARHALVDALKAIAIDEGSSCENCGGIPTSGENRCLACNGHGKTWNWRACRAKAALKLADEQ
jgi:hypothetical protein